MEEEGQVVIRSSTGEEPITQYKVCKLNVVPKEIFVKFRKEVEGYRVGVNLEFHTAPYKEDLARLVIKPLAPNQRWKFTYDSWHHEVRLLSKKIPITKFLNFHA
ncbi:uncharacterized protein LOC132053663 [Lycium ferocissimum]|uniref:uncharacterized protein LOC132053663 n=1 Tax=Lycium ferocissimum TaxID=112874 RepID=UPI0028152BC7|nr:uncharacterized protein LOC132053663 [Lycium ferocissimum]